MATRKSRVMHGLQLSGMTFSEIQDSRREQGLVHRLPALLRLLVVGVGCSKTTIRSVEELGGDLPAQQLRKLGFTRAPSDTVLHNVMSASGEAGFQEQVFQQVEAAERSGAFRNDLLPAGMLAFDGKSGANDLGEPPNEECRPTVHDEDGSPCWYMSAMRAVLCSSSAAPCVGQQVMGPTTGEHATFPELLKTVAVRLGHLFKYVSFDAGITSKENTTHVREQSKHYVGVIRGNNGNIYKFAREALFKAPVCAEDISHERGCVVQRMLRRVAAPKDCGYKDAAQLWLVEHVRTDLVTHKVSHYGFRIFLTSIPWKELSPKQVLAAVRLHWAGVENRANWTKDAVLLEDTHTMCMQGDGPQVCSWLTVLAYNLLALFRGCISAGRREKTSWKRSAELLRDRLLSTFIGRLQPVTLV